MKKIKQNKGALKSDLERIFKTMNFELDKIPLLKVERSELKEYNELLNDIATAGSNIKEVLAARYARLEFERAISVLGLNK